MKTKIKTREVSRREFYIEKDYIMRTKTKTYAWRVYGEKFTTLSEWNWNKKGMCLSSTGTTFNVCHYYGDKK